MPNNKRKILLVVGDRLNNFATHKNVITISELEILIDNHKDETIYEIHIGQGINEERLKALFLKIQYLYLSDSFQFVNSNSYKKSSNHLTHKHKSENIMISEPNNISADIYECYLMLEDNC